MAVRWLKRNWHYLLSHLAGIVPLLVIATYYLSDTLANPVRYIILRTGTIGLIFLVASLACTPVRVIFGWSGAIQIRRALGLYGFLYAALHLGAYLVLENELYFDLIWRDLGERRAMLIGLVAFLLLLPLALTSTRGWQRRLGKRWRTLHRLIYLALPLSVWHYLWLDRDFITVPLIYAVIVGIHLLVRLPMVCLTYKKRMTAE
jgi:sulfoxide reductase heme-binding subunit YedZ